MYYWISYQVPNIGNNTHIRYMIYFTKSDILLTD